MSKKGCYLKLNVLTVSDGVQRGAIGSCTEWTRPTTRTSAWKFSRWETDSGISHGL